MKQLFALLLFVSLNYLSVAQSTFTTVNYTNNSGQDLVIAFAQGALPGQGVYQTDWLQYNAATQSYGWSLPAPTKASDLTNYIFSIKKGKSIAIQVPAYNAAVGFRCLIADTVYRTKAFIPANIKTKTPAYMAFPDMETDTYLFDKFEAGLTIGSPGIWNITAVDFVAIPMQLSSGNQTVGFKNGVTASGLYAVLNQLGNPYNQGGYITPNSNTKTVRYFSPANIPAATKVLDSLILTQASQINSAAVVNYGNYVFTNLTGTATPSVKKPVVGTVSASYTCSSCGITTPRSISVNDVTSVKALAGTIVGANPNNSADSLAQIQLGAILSAAICRGILSSPTSWGDIVHYKSNCPYPWNYYPKGVQSDRYSKVIHQYSIDSKNYGFPYDDYFGDEAGFTVLPGDNVTVNILPLTGTMTAQPNGAIPQQTGCLMVTVPSGKYYPSSTGWPLGTVYVEGQRVITGSSTFCSLPNDTIKCTFSNKPNVTMNILVNPAKGSPAYSFSDKSGTAFKVNGISNMAYDNTQFNLTFPNAVNWQYSGSWSITIPTPTSSWNIGTISVNGQALVPGMNANLIQSNSTYGDTVICTFSNQPGVQLCLIQNQPPLFRTTTSSATPVNGITGMNVDPSGRTVSFGASSSFQYANSWTITLPGSKNYPNGRGWKIGPVMVNGTPLNPGPNANLLPNSGDTLICTFQNSPKLQMCLIQGQNIVFKNSDNSPCNVTGIVGLSPTPVNNTITFGAAASWQK